MRRFVVCMALLGVLLATASAQESAAPAAGAGAGAGAGAAGAGAGAASPAPLSLPSMSGNVPTTTSGLFSGTPLTSGGVVSGDAFSNIPLTLGNLDTAFPETKSSISSSNALPGSSIFDTSSSFGTNLDQALRHPDDLPVTSDDELDQLKKDQQLIHAKRLEITQVKFALENEKDQITNVKQQISVNENIMKGKAAELKRLQAAMAKHSKEWTARMTGSGGGESSGDAKKTGFVEERSQVRAHKPAVGAGAKGNATPIRKLAKKVRFRAKQQQQQHQKLKVAHKMQQKQHQQQKHQQKHQQKQNHDQPKADSDYDLPKLPNLMELENSAPKDKYAPANNMDLSYVKRFLERPVEE